MQDGLIVEILNTNIVDLDIDAIVNPSNKWLLAGSGLCGEIYKKADKFMLETATRKICQLEFNGNVPVGSAVVTDAYKLKCKGIIHVVPPKFLIDPIITLKDCYKNALLVAEGKKYTSIAFPAIGIGINRIPINQTFNQILEVLQSFKPQYVNKIIFCVNDNEIEALYRVHLKTFLD
jgi:O-acetyl-ADP-ribose deacetylase (regulator of RNase III)